MERNNSDTPNFATAWFRVHVCAFTFKLKNTGAKARSRCKGVAQITHQRDMQTVNVWTLLASQPPVCGAPTAHQRARHGFRCLSCR